MVLGELNTLSRSDPGDPTRRSDSGDPTPFLNSVSGVVLLNCCPVPLELPLAADTGMSGDSSLEDKSSKSLVTSRVC